MPYKKTLNIPETKFPMRAGLVENEKKFKAFLEKSNIYEELRNRSGEKSYILHDGPPYANGNIHVGHALNKILKDFICRYKSLLGYRIEYVPGWDTHGLPIENRIEKIGNYRSKSAIEKRKACREYALEQIENQKKQFERLHLLNDFKYIYKTLDPSYVAFELDIFSQFIEQELLYWDLKPVAWSWSSRTALAESEIIYKEVESRSIYAWMPTTNDFKEIPQGTKLLIWTTTPYTLEANLAIVVNPDFDYELIETSDNGIFLLLEGKGQELGIEGKVIGKIVGKELVGCKYLNPLTKEENRIISANYVTKDAGTGLVHTAPGFGLDDYYAALEHGISIYSAIEDNGCFSQETKFPPVNGFFYADAIDVVIEWLKKEGYLFKEEKIAHNIGHDWRTEKPLLYRASPQWFINVSKLQNRNFKLSSEVKSNPSWLIKKLEELINSRKEWCLSRQRVWGVPIPMLFDGKDPIMDLKQIRHTIALINEHGIDSWFEKDAAFFLHPDTKVQGELNKSKDILDVWFDSGCSWGILKDKQADLYLEGFDQLRGWFNSSSTISLAIQNKPPFKTLLAHGFVLDGEGNKMSKSKGNVIDPLEIANKNGVDILRLWLAGNNFLEDIKLSETSLEHAITLYRKIRNTLFRYSLSIFPEGFQGRKDILQSLESPENIYIYALFRKEYKDMKEQLDNFQFFKALKTSMNFLNTYSSWYLEICKDTLYCNNKDSKEYLEIISVIYEIFKKSLIFYSIIIPQTAEEAYQYLNCENKKASICLESWSELDEKEYEIDSQWNRFWDLRTQVLGEIEILRNQKIINDSWEASVTITEEQLIPEWNLTKLLNVAEVKIGKEFSVEKTSLQYKCLRCKRYKETLVNEDLCARCQDCLNKG